MEFQRGNCCFRRPFRHKIWNLEPRIITHPPQKSLVQPRRFLPKFKNSKKSSNKTPTHHQSTTHTTRTPTPSRSATSRSRHLPTVALSGFARVATRSFASSITERTPKAASVAS
uniref:(northern house mosquito) hypothetical protein n=1 Tax=Culex pipiens TaxID=7175 RepID=A0A8D8K0U1_CULPI